MKTMLKLNQPLRMNYLRIICFMFVSAIAQSATAAIDSTHVINPTTTDRRICTRLMIGSSDIASGTTTFSMTNRSCIPVGVPGAPSGGSCDMMCQSAVVHDAGSGYKVGDVITLGGNYTSPCKFTVTSLKGTAPNGVSGVSVAAQGRYAAANVPKTNPVAQQSTTGTGSGVTLDVTLTTDSNSCGSGSGGGAGFGAVLVPQTFSGGGNVGITCPSDYPYFSGVKEIVVSSPVWIAPPVWATGIGSSGACCATPAAPQTTKYSSWQTPDSSGNCPAGTGY